MFKTHKIKFLFLFCGFSFALTNAQVNLVPNPSFESYSACPDNISSPSDDQVSRANGWSSYRETPDYFHVCGSIWEVGVPNNLPGYQNAHTGNAYCGLISFYIAGPDSREVIGCNLTSTLSVGQKYFVSFYTNFAGKPGNSLATNNVGIRFSKNQFSYSTPTPINNYAHLKLNTKNTDTLNWIKVFGSFVADSAYKYIAIGNFFNDINTDTLSYGAFPYEAYYFIDDVCVSTDSTYANNWTGISEYGNKNSLNIYPNPFTEKFRIKCNAEFLGKKIKCQIFDLFENLIREKQNDTDEIVEFSDLQNLPQGVYIIKIESDYKTINQIIIKQ